MERRLVSSSTLKEVGYDEQTKTLEILFCSEGLYSYSCVPQEVYDAFLKSESKGKFFMENVRGKFEYICLNPRPPKEKEGERHGQPEAKEDSKSEAKRKAAQTKPAKT